MCSSSCISIISWFAISFRFKFKFGFAVILLFNFVDVS